MCLEVVCFRRKEEHEQENASITGGFLRLWNSAKVDHRPRKHKDGMGKQLEGRRSLQSPTVDLPVHRTELC